MASDAGAEIGGRWSGMPPAAGAAGAARGPAGGARAAPPPWDLLLAAVVVYLLTSVARIHMLVPALGALRITMVGGAAALLLYVLSHHPSRSFSRLASPTTGLLAAFTLWMALTVPWGLRQYRGLVFVFDNFLKTVALFVVVVGCVRGLRDVERLAFVYFAGAVAYAALIMVQFGAGDSWRLGDLVTYDANDFAVLAVSAVPLGVYFLGGGRRRTATRVFVALGLAVVGVAFVQAGSRGGLLAMGAVMLFLLVRYRGLPLRWRIGGVGLLGLVAALFASQRYWDQMATLLDPSGDYNITSETGRLQLWQRGLGYLWEHPVLGVGPSNFPVAEGVLSPMAFRQEYGIGVRWTAPHNSFLQVAVELGIPGLLLFVAMLGSVVLALRRIEGWTGSDARRGGAGSTSDRAALAQAILGSLVGFLVGAFFLSLAYSAMLFTLLAFAVALRKVTPTAREGPPRRGARTSAPDPDREVAEPGEPNFVLR